MNSWCSACSGKGSQGVFADTEEGHLTTLRGKPHGQGKPSGEHRLGGRTAWVTVTSVSPSGASSRQVTSLPVARQFDRVT